VGVGEKIKFYPINVKVEKGSLTSGTVTSIGGGRSTCSVSKMYIMFTLFTNTEVSCFQQQLLLMYVADFLFFQN